MVFNQEIVTRKKLMTLMVSPACIMMLIYSWAGLYFESAFKKYRDLFWSIVASWSI